MPDLQPITASFSINNPPRIGNLIGTRKECEHRTRGCFKGRNTMQKTNCSFVPAISVGLLAAVFVINTNSAAPAAAACIEKPGLQSDQNGHWYYRVDRVNHRRCWFLQSSGTPTANIDPATAVPTGSYQQPALLSWLSSVVSTITGVSAAGGDQTAAVRSSRIVPAALDASIKRRSRMVRHVNVQEASVPKLPAPSSPQPLATFQEQTDSPPIDPMKREALYQEFLRWQDQRYPW